MSEPYEPLFDPTTCTACRHAWSSHPINDAGALYCSRSLYEPPSCTECAALWHAIQERLLPKEQP